MRIHPAQTGSHLRTEATALHTTNVGTIGSAKLGALCQRVVRLQVVLVALERPDGLLIDRRLTVIAVRPNQVKAMRPRYRVAGGKSEGLDGFVLAELARTEATASRCWCPTATRPRRFGA